MKRMIHLTIYACIAMMCVCFASCNDDAIVEVSQSNETGQPFRLTASQATPSRLALGEDGLSVMWEPGDKLYLVKKDRSTAPIELIADIEEAAAEATFTSRGAVPAGEYHVVYNYNSDLVYGHHPFMSIDKINNQDNLALWGSLKVMEGDASAQISLTHIYAKIRVELENAGDNCNYDIGMYASGANGFPILKKLTEGGLVDAYPNGSDYIVSENVKYHNIYLGFYPLESYANEAGEKISNLDEVKRFSSLVLPANVSDGILYFYVIDIYNNKCYEFQKSNVDFKEGKSYVVKLNLSEPNATSELQTKQVTFPGETWENDAWMLRTTADCRHVAYRGGLGIYNICSIEQYIDFANEAFFPLNTTYLLGNGNKLSNITLNWPDDNNVGLIRKEWSVERAGSYDMYSEYYRQLVSGNQKYISDLTLENVVIEGHDYVGALGGLNIAATDCAITGSSSIKANGDYAGGLVGYCCSYDYRGVSRFSDNIIESTCSIQGCNYVGGLIGSIFYAGETIEKTEVLIGSCSSAATVSATGNYVGGIIGKLEGESSVGENFVLLYGNDAMLTLNECFNFGTVKGVDYVGGIVGDFALYTSEEGIDRVVIKQSANEGNINGTNYVGGIAGRTYASINTCYSINDISASGSYVGGIVGAHYNEKNNTCNRIANCYSLSEISAENDEYVGGIVGCLKYYEDGYSGGKVQNSYFAGTNTTNNGIIGGFEGSCTISNCVTTLSSLGPNLDNTDMVSNSFADVTSIFSKIEVLNSGGENAYSTNEEDIWEGNDYQAVKFASGLSGTIPAPGFGSSEIEI